MWLTHALQKCQLSLLPINDPAKKFTRKKTQTRKSLANSKLHLYRKPYENPMKSNHQGPLRWFPYLEVWVPRFDLNRVSILLGWCETTPQVRGWQSRSTCTDCAVQHAWVNLSPGSVSRGLNIRLRDGWRLTLSVGHGYVHELSADVSKQQSAWPIWICNVHQKRLTFSCTWIWVTTALDNMRQWHRRGSATLYNFT